MFIKLCGLYIPLYESGSNNCYEPAHNMRRERVWSHHLPCCLRGDNKSMPLFTESELMTLVSSNVEEQIDCGTAIYGNPRAGRTALINYWQRGIDRARTFSAFRAAGIELQVTSGNYPSPYTRQVSDYDQFVVAWDECIKQCGSARLVPVGIVTEMQYRALNPPVTKKRIIHNIGYVVRFGGNYVHKMTPRHLFHIGYLNDAHVYTTRTAAEEVVQRIRRCFPGITDPKVIVVNNVKGRWQQTA